MTIASEISRLQCAKSDICTAIENKGVTVGDITIDNYAECIDAIQQGGGGYCLDYLVVGGGGGGGGSSSGNSSNGGGGGGGGGGGVQLGIAEKFTDTVMNVCVGKGGAGGKNNNISFCYYGYIGISCNGGGSALGKVYAAGGGAGGSHCFPIGRDGGSGGGGCSGVSISYSLFGGGRSDGKSIGNDGGFAINPFYAGGGGGAGNRGGIQGQCTRCNQGCTCCEYAHGGSAIYTDITGKEEYFAAGGGGGGYCSPGMGGFGAGDAGNCGGNATCCGSGGGGGYTCGGCGAGGIVVVRYPKDGSYGITNAIGGCKYECGDYCIHCFTQDGYFAINPTGCHISYLAVGGGGGRNCGGGGGGAVCFGTKEVTTDSLCIVVGAGGGCLAGCKGGDSCIGEDVIAKGGEAGYYCNPYVYGGKSGSGCTGGRFLTTVSNFKPGGGGASSNVYGFDPKACCKVGYVQGLPLAHGGFGYFGFGGGGAYCYTGHGRDGGAGDGMMTYGGGGGYTSSGCICDCGFKGVVDICYPIDGSYGFTNATGGNCCYQCGDMCVHRFTSDGTFTIVS